MNLITEHNKPCIIKNLFFSSRNFIKELSLEDKDALLLNLLSIGQGSLECARDMIINLEDQPGPYTLNPNSQREWCVCGVCRVMPLDIENKCCGKRKCVTSYTMFNNICIDREVLTLAIRARFDILAEEVDYSTNSFRKAAHRQYCLWKYGNLGRGNRRVLPSCVVLTIRLVYPSADGICMGFKNS